MRLAHGVVPLLALAFAGCGGCRTGEVSAPVKEIATESIEKVGDTWNIKFTSRIDAPVDKVYEAMSQPERMREYLPEAVVKSELVKQEGDAKTVDLVFKLDILPPGFKVQNIRNDVKLFPGEKRMTQRSVDFKLADIASEYALAPAPDGKGTILTFTQTSKDKGGLPVESLQKGALRETYIMQVRAMNKALGLAEPPAAEPAG
jgi:hypothetical protein